MKQNIETDHRKTMNERRSVILEQVEQAEKLAVAKNKRDTIRMKDDRKEAEQRLEQERVRRQESLQRAVQKEHDKQAQAREY